MVKIYVSLNPEGFITGWGNAEYGTITTDPKDSILLSLGEDHDLFNGFEEWRYVNGELFKDDKQLVDNLKNAKKEELSKACQDCILDGFISKVDGIDYHFSYDREAQINYQERWQLFQNNMIKSIIVTAHNLDDKSVVRVSVDKLQFNSIYLDSIKHKEDCINRLHDVLIPLAEETETVEELEEINWNMQLEETDKPTIEVKDDKLLSVLVNANQEKNLLLETAVMDVAMQVYQ